MESRDELLKELAVIEKWEKDQNGVWFWEKISRLPFKILDKLTPKFIHEKIGDLLDEIGAYVQSGGKYLTIEKSLFTIIEKEAETPINTVLDIKDLPLELMEKISNEIIEKRKKFAAIQGATTGVGGIFTLAIDIPALLAVSLKTLQEISLIHGYDPNEKNERIFIIKVLQFSMADVVGKRAILDELSNYYRKENHKSGEMMTQLQGWREVVYTYRDQLGWKKLFQLVPLAGIIFGAFTNRSMINDLSVAGIMLYRKRKIIERLELVE
ncbi:MAG: EcsC family protein [Bacillota bacterium]|nr:EcsC family protein [Bacillota bacterium]